MGWFASVSAWACGVLLGLGSSGQAIPPAEPAVPSHVRSAAADVPSTQPAEQDAVQGPHDRTASRLAEVSSTQPAVVEDVIAFEDLVLLVKTARRAFRRSLLDQPEGEARYCPPALEKRQGMVYLTLRSHGTIVAEAHTNEIEVVSAANAAGVLLARSVREKGLKVEEGGDAYGLEFELLGPREYLAQGLTETHQWSDALIHAFEPAKEGIGVEFRGRRGWTRASEIVSLNYTPDLALQGAEAAIGLRYIDRTRHAQDIRYFRFEAYHLWQRGSRELPTLLARGDTLVDATGITCETLDAAIDRLGHYLHYRQNRDGWFSHEYLPTPDRYGSGNIARVQMRALAGMAEYARWSGRPDVMEGAGRGIEKTALFLNPLTVVSVGEEGKPQSDESGLVLFFPGHEDYLENTAWFLMTLLWAAEDTSWDARRMGLINGILGAQDDRGRLRMEFAPKPEDAVESPAPAGWALLALARSMEWRGDERMEPAFARALGYYGSTLREQVTPAAGASLAMGFTAGYAITNDARASDAVFSVLDRFVARQVTASACPWPELHGAINAGTPGVVGVDTATYLAALADGLTLARRIGDKVRVQRYEKAVLSAARFVLQLEVRPPGCYYIRSERDALGGVRTALWDNRIRVDHCAAALSGLIHARRALFGERSLPTSRPAGGS